jgi:hypothetical protein
MLCQPQIIKSTDRPFWIKREDFQRLVHIQNYMCREEQYVYPNAYLNEWFGPPDGKGIRSFSVPAVWLKGGRITFINGRHRTAVLVEHLEILPMALTNDAGDDHESLFNSIKHSDLNLNDLIQIPDLPILSKEALELLVDRSRPRVPTPDPW